ncbi:MAG: class I SAM-dependent methyltransferase [Clostridia bacterium]|nr:class I SAM-dependent methyltransferase [Clostridia bacterium]
MWKADNWTDYELIDTSNGERLERWGKHILIRPDPQVIWKDVKRDRRWNKPDGTYKRSSAGGGAWKSSALPEQWDISYESLGLNFLIKPTGFKHTGLFPEQAVNWEWFSKLIKEAGRPIKVLNLFAYTGGATVACAKAGASVCHVDASKGMVAQAKINAEKSGLGSAPIRYIVDDCKKFIEREIRRQNKYDAIIMDPTSYGRGPSGELWKLEDSIAEFISLSAQLMSDDPLFFLLNSYTTGLSASTMGYLLDLYLKPLLGGQVISDEIGLPVSQTGSYLPCGASSRWTKCK